MILANKVVKNSKVVIFGIIFKENCLDVRYFKVYDIIKRLSEYGIEPIVVAPQANAVEAKVEYNVDLVNINDIKNVDCLIFAVAHNEFKSMSFEIIDGFFGDYPNNGKVIIDIKSIFDKTEIEKLGYSYWRL